MHNPSQFQITLNTFAISRMGIWGSIFHLVNLSILIFFEAITIFLTIILLVCSHSDTHIFNKVFFANINYVKISIFVKQNRTTYTYFQECLEHHGLYSRHIRVSSILFPRHIMIDYEMFLKMTKKQLKDILIWKRSSCHPFTYLRKRPHVVVFFIL